MDIRLSGLSADMREHYEERAAIIEFDAGIPRRSAEAMALQDVFVIQERQAKSEREAMLDTALVEASFRKAGSTGGFEGNGTGRHE